MQRILITGGCGFIGSNFVLKQVQAGKNSVLNFDKLTYAGNIENLFLIDSETNYQFVIGNICDPQVISDAIGQFQPNAIVHFAAESHVDRSIDSPMEFIHTNIVGTATLLNAALDYWQSIIDKKNKKKFRFLHVSTDEVFGSLDNEEFFIGR